MTSPAVPQRPGGRAALRPLGCAEVLDGAVRFVRRNPRTAFGFALPIALVQAALAAVVLLSTYSSPGLSAVSQLLRLLVSISAGTVLSGLLAPVVTADALGHPIAAAESWRRSRGVQGLLLLVVLGVGVAVVETLGLVLAAVGGLWLWGVWAVVGPAMAVEGLGPVAALRRSFRLAGRRFWRAWGVRALGWVVTYVLSFLVTLPFTALAAYVGSIGFGQSTGDVVHPGLFVTLTALGQLLAVALVAPVAAAVDGLLYVDLRVRVEGLDIVLAAPAPTIAAAVPVSAW